MHNVTCENCIRTDMVIRYGRAAGKQIYYCKRCEKKFTEPSLLKRARHNPEIITMALDLYFDGFSLRKTARTINRIYGTSINHATLYSWIQKYIPKIMKYTDSLMIPASKRWDIDETFVRVRKGEKYSATAGMGYLWNIMDHDTRFLVVSKMSSERDIDGMLTAFKKALVMSDGAIPDVVSTDALPAYPAGVRKMFPGAEHLVKVGISKRENNNRIERMHGTQKERIKIQRGWKKVDTPIQDGMRINYNYNRPHEALDGNTPAQQMGVVSKKMGWQELLQKSLEYEDAGT